MMNKRAFSLLEVMVALGIIAISISSILSSMAVGASLPHDSKRRMKAVDLSVIKLHEMERKLKKDGFKDEDVEEQGDFDDEEFKEYRWIARIKKIEIPDDIAMLTKLFLGGGDDDVDENGTSKPQSKMDMVAGLLGGFIQELKDTFEESIREIEIEVFWYYGAEEEENKEKFILTTHVIDFTKIKSLSGGGTSTNTLQRGGTSKTTTKGAK